MMISQAIDEWVQENGRAIGDYIEGTNCFNIYFGRTPEPGYPDYDDSTQKNPENSADLVDLWYKFAEENNFALDSVVGIEEDWDPYAEEM